MPSRQYEPETYTDDEAIRRGARAHAILGDEIFKEAVELAGQSFYDEWLHAKTPQVREAMWAKTLALGAVEDSLRSIMADGEVAASRVS